MEIAKDTPQRKVVIQGVQIEVASPFAEGHTCTANEAAVLNQVLAENVRNNTAKSVSALNDAAGEGNTADPAAVQKLVNEYIASYEFGVKRGGGGTLGATEEERYLRSEARKAVRKALSARGHKLKDIDASEINRLADEALETNADFKKRLLAQFKQFKATEASIGEINL